MSLLAALYRGGLLRTLDHALAESLRRLRADTPDEVLAAIALTSRAVADGHSQLPLSRAGELLIDLADEREPPPLPALDDWLAVLRVSPWIEEAQVAVLEGEALSLGRYWHCETQLANAIAARLTDGRGRLRLITGGPGTGKTTYAARLLAELAADRADPLRIALAAPTGKAAGRLGEVVQARLADLAADGVAGAESARAAPIEARTLHRLLGWRSDGSVGFDAARPLPFDAVVVDEASMIDLPMMARLFAAVAPAACLVLIGDPDQLPSVQTGDVLAALCAAAVSRGTAARPVETTPVGATPVATSAASEREVATGVALTAIPRTHLTQIHRQADDIDVGELAVLIRDGQAEAAIAGLTQTRFRGVHWRPGNDRDLPDHVLGEALPAYRAVQAAANPQAALAQAARYRVLTAVREGPAGSQTLNALIAAALDPARRGTGHFAGQLLLITENSYRHGLFNGDLGVVWPDEQGELRVWFEAGPELRAWLPAALPAHESAYALTVHKAQGSEFELVFLALPERGARVLARELLYTGLTRCRREIVLWANEATLRETIARKAQRWSGLAARLA